MDSKNFAPPPAPPSPDQGSVQPPPTPAPAPAPVVVPEPQPDGPTGTQDLPAPVDETNETVQPDMRNRAPRSTTNQVAIIAALIAGIAGVAWYAYRKGHPATASKSKRSRR